LSDSESFHGSAGEGSRNSSDDADEQKFIEFPSSSQDFSNRMNYSSKSGRKTFPRPEIKVNGLIAVNAKRDLKSSDLNISKTPQ
jgi:hypothetical protein